MMSGYTAIAVAQANEEVRLGTSQAGIHAVGGGGGGDDTATRNAANLGMVELNELEGNS